jgi:hypothetical protein
MSDVSEALKREGGEDYRESPANLPTLNSVDPLCGIPEYKHCAVRVDHA